MHINTIIFEGLRKLRLNHRNGKKDDSSPPGFAPRLINVIVGPNGGGKSTIIDAIRCASDPRALATIFRENIATSTNSELTIEFKNKHSLQALFQKTDVDTCEVTLSIGYPDGIKALTIGKIENGNITRSLSSLIRSLGVNVLARTSHNEEGVELDNFVSVLNENSKHLVGLLPYPLLPGQITMDDPDFDWSNPNASISIRDQSTLSIYFNDDQFQPSHVPISLLPSGWRAFGGLIAWLSEAPKECICIIEEPETHIHPRLLRILMQRMNDIAVSSSLQIFITTHSPTLIDVGAWPVKDISLYEANGYELRELTDVANTLSMLGIKPSDISQSNGVIWVEGASDRLYILHWIELWCRNNEITPPVENYEYSFLFYGGSMLGHFTAQREEHLIDIFKINRNSMVVMDRDLDFLDSEPDARPTNSTSETKTKILTSVPTWLTQGYTIESYLPKAFFDHYFHIVGGRAKKKSGYSKVEIARRFIEQHRDFRGSFLENSDLPYKIKTLLEEIHCWNRA